LLLDDVEAAMVPSLSPRRGAMLPSGYHFERES
jgi:hypothetical protein